MEMNRTMAEVTNTAVVLKEDEIELELGLSIGGKFKRPDKLKPIKKEPVHVQHINDSKLNSFDTDPRENHQTFVKNVEQESDLFDPLKKREIHALRRQEAKRKREEKQQKKGLCSGKNGENSNGAKMWLGALEFETKENQFGLEEQGGKKNKIEDAGSGNNKTENVNLNFGVERNGNHNLSSNPPMCPIMPMQFSYPYPYPPVQYVPFTNGYAYSCVNVMQCWAAGGNERNVTQPMGNRSFRPFQSGQDSGLNLANGYDSEQNSSRDGGNRKTMSNGSPMCSSSAVSDYQSSSQLGGSNSDTGSHSYISQLEQPQINSSVASNIEGQSKHSASSHPMESTPSVDKSTKYIEKSVSLNATETCPTKSNEETISKTQSSPVSKLISTTENPTTTLTKETSRDMGKPPKPQTQGQNTSSIPHMPCVSTTGNGPNGKTINGFLYRYTKSEVSIICVCHGSSFSPAEFVQHAGGADVSHPLRHITVIPSAFL